MDRFTVAQCSDHGPELTLGDVTLAAYRLELFEDGCDLGLAGVSLHHDDHRPGFRALLDVESLEQFRSTPPNTVPGSTGRSQR